MKKASPVSRHVSVQMMDILNKLMQTVSIFMCFWFKWHLPMVSDFYCDHREAYLSFKLLIFKSLVDLELRFCTHRTSSEYLRQVSISRSLAQGQGRRNKNGIHERRGISWNAHLPVEYVTSRFLYFREFSRILLLQ